MFDSKVAREWVGEARGAVGTGCDVVIEGLKGRQHGAVDTCLL